MAASITICTTRGVPATWRLAEQVAACLPNGGVIALQGELGAGKTTFVQGVARALGITRPVTSPTFTLVGEYPGDRMLLVHMDLYRLRSPDDLLTIGFQEYLDRKALLAVEWPDRAGDLLPPNTIRVTISLTPNPRNRRFEIEYPARRASA